MIPIIYNSFSEELHGSSLKTGEQEEIEKELQLAENSTEIQSSLSHSVELLEERESSIISQLTELEQFLDNLEKFDDSISDLRQRAQSSRIELDDITSELKQKLSTIEFEPGKAEELDERLSLLISLQRKHQVNSVEELIEKRETLDERIQELTGLEDRIGELEAKMEEAQLQLERHANKIHDSRQKLIPELESQIMSILNSLNFAQANFTIKLDRTELYTEKGNDIINFLFSANPGMREDKISKSRFRR